MNPVLPPGTAYREHQEQTVGRIVGAFMGGVRTVFLDSPVGSGKSVIHLALSKTMGVQSYITTPQVLLVKQYAHDTDPGGKWVGMASTVMGRSNYPCPYAMRLPVQTTFKNEVDEVLGTLSPKMVTAANARCRVAPHWPAGRHKHHPDRPLECITRSEQGYDPCVQGCSHYVFSNPSPCPYYQAKKAAAGAHTAVMTLDYFMAVMGGAGAWPFRPLLVVDEAHSLDMDLTRFYTIEIRPHLFPGLDLAGMKGASDTVAVLRTVLPDYLVQQMDVLKGLQRGVDPDTLSEKEFKHLLRQSHLVDRVTNFLDLLSTRDVRWVYIPHLDEAAPERSYHEWRPLTPDPFTRNFFRRFDYVLLSSGTLLDPARLVTSLGLPTPWSSVVVPNTFPAENAPIHLLNAVRLRHKTMDRDLPVVVNHIVALSKLHTDQRGVVHCNSYRVAHYLREHAPPELSDRLVFHEKEGRTAMFEEWRADRSVGSIFVGVAMSEGLDLPGDEARWQVIVKAPFLPVKDPWVAARMAEPDGEQWYAEQALMDVLQACGRIVRSRDDWGVTYVIDAQVGRLVRENVGVLPEWFRERVQNHPS